MKALVIGATGLTGTEVINLLIKDSECSSIQTISRRSGVSNPKITEQIINLDDLSTLSDKLNGVFSAEDFAICCLGTTIKTAGSQEAFHKVDYGYVIEFAKLCKKIGIEKLGVVSAYGADSKSKIFYSKTKGEVEEELKKLEFQHLVIAHPGLLLGHRKEFRLGERIAVLASPIFNKLLLGPLSKMRSVEAKDVARALITALKHPIQKIQIIEGLDFQKKN
jgi:uncharacterized protein YbjT (DUF2867 family)